jgi:hypothetical protein
LVLVQEAMQLGVLGSEAADLVHKHLTAILGVILLTVIAVTDSAAPGLD